MPMKPQCSNRSTSNIIRTHITCLRLEAWPRVDALFGELIEKNHHDLHHGQFQGAPRTNEAFSARHRRIVTAEPVAIRESFAQQISILHSFHFIS
jgi:hypothetical protein